MKFSLNFYKGSKYLDTADELIISYNKNSANLINFAEKRPKEQRLVVSINMFHIIEDEKYYNMEHAYGKRLELVITDMIEIFKATMEKHPNTVFRVDDYEYKTVYKALKENELPFFLTLRCSTWQNVVDLCNAEVSDIYVTNELGFDIIRVSAYCAARGVHIRVFPNVAQSSTYVDLGQKPSGDVTKFYIRPEDLSLYGKYVDIIEFWGDLKDQDLVYEIYKEGKWLGRLDQIILGMTNDKIYNRELSGMFAAQRLGCQKRCNYSKCHNCWFFEHLSNRLFDNNLTLDFEKPEVFLTKEEYEEKLVEVLDWYFKRKEANNERKITAEDLEYESTDLT